MNIVRTMSGIACIAVASVAAFAASDVAPPRQYDAPIRLHRVAPATNDTPTTETQQSDASKARDAEGFLNSIAPPSAPPADGNRPLVRRPQKIRKDLVNDNRKDDALMTPTEKERQQEKDKPSGWGWLADDLKQTARARETRETTKDGAQENEKDVAENERDARNGDAEDAGAANKRGARNISAAGERIRDAAAHATANDPAAASPAIDAAKAAADVTDRRASIPDLASRNPVLRPWPGSSAPVSMPADEYAMPRFDARALHGMDAPDMPSATAPALDWGFGSSPFANLSPLPRLDDPISSFKPSSPLPSQSDNDAARPAQRRSDDQDGGAAKRSTLPW